jgi:CheY-like chemotaxis protein
MASASTGRPILVVDDCADDLVFIRRRLDKAGIRTPVLTFLSSEDALAHLRSLARAKRTPEELFPRLVFLDIKMPRIDGFEILREIRAERAFSDLKVVMLSGSDEPRDKERAAKMGADHYLVKFPAVEDLERIVASVN